jgi:hypothetical protein
MTLPDIMEKVKTAWSSGWQALVGRRSYFMHYATEWCGLL